MEYIMKMKRPASWHNDNWREGTPLGNGLHGALMYGNTANERVILTHTRLWREGKSFDMRNLFTTHNDWRGSGIGLSMASAPFQIDANTGWPSAIQEMLLFSDCSRVDILPALPKQWKKGRIGPLQARCGVEVTARWENSKGKASIKADRDTHFMLYLPMNEEKGIEKQLKKNEIFCIDFYL